MNYPTDARTITLSDGKERKIRFTLKTFQKLKARFKVSFLMGEGWKNLDEDVIPYIVYEALVDKQGLTADIISELITMDHLPVVIECITAAINPKGTEAAKDTESKN